MRKAQMRTEKSIVVSVANSAMIGANLLESDAAVLLKLMLKLSKQCTVY